MSSDHFSHLVLIEFEKNHSELTHLAFTMNKLISFLSSLHLYIVATVSQIFLGLAVILLFETILKIMHGTRFKRNFINS